MFGLSKFSEFTIYILQRSFYVEFASEYYANDKPDVKILANSFLVIIFSFKFIIVQSNT